MPDALLALKDVHVHYGGVKALDGASVAVDEGEVVALMGPNGAGKSTVLKAFFGLAPIASGEVLWHGQPVRPVAHEMVRRGVSFVPQGRRVFRHLTVRENLLLGGFLVTDKAELARRLDEVLGLFPILKNKINAKSGALSGGGQQMVAIARGLMTDPKVLLLDEPSLGLAPKVGKEGFEKIKEINERHQTAIVGVEHNLKSLLQIADRAYLLVKGKVLAEREPSDLINSGLLEKALLS